METITITKKEYEALVFAKKGFLGSGKTKVKEFIDAGFGVLKNSFGKSSSISLVNKLRKSWRE